MPTNLAYAHRKGEDVAVKNNGGSAIADGTLVKYDTSNPETLTNPMGVVQTAANTDIPWGVAIETIAAGDIGRVRRLTMGSYEIITTAGVTAGDLVMPAAAGKCDTATSAKPTFGIARFTVGAGLPVTIDFQGVAKNALAATEKIYDHQLSRFAE